MILSRYLMCGHVGRPTLRGSGWIRVAETRKAAVITVPDTYCPQCGGGGKV